jgi:hypothetical protein
MLITNEQADELLLKLAGLSGLDMELVEQTYCRLDALVLPPRIHQLGSLCLRRTIKPPLTVFTRSCRT